MHAVPQQAHTFFPPPLTVRNWKVHINKSFFKAYKNVLFKCWSLRLKPVIHKSGEQKENSEKCLPHRVRKWASGSCVFPGHSPRKAAGAAGSTVPAPTCKLLSQHMLKLNPTRSGHARPHLVKSWVPPQTEMPQPPWATSVLSPHSCPTSNQTLLVLISHTVR